MPRLAVAASEASFQVWCGAVGKNQKPSKAELGSTQGTDFSETSEALSLPELGKKTRVPSRPQAVHGSTRPTTPRKLPSTRKQSQQQVRDRSLFPLPQIGLHCSALARATAESRCLPWCFTRCGTTAQRGSERASVLQSASLARHTRVSPSRLCGSRSRRWRTTTNR